MEYHNELANVTHAENGLLNVNVNVNESENGNSLWVSEERKKYTHLYFTAKINRNHWMGDQSEHWLYPEYPVVGVFCLCARVCVWKSVCETRNETEKDSRSGKSVKIVCYLHWMNSILTIRIASIHWAW